MLQDNAQRLKRAPHGSNIILIRIRRSMMWRRGIGVLAVIAIAGAVNAATISSTTPAADVKNLPLHKELPDALVGSDGRRITSPEQWEQRRAEMKAVIERYLTGHTPPPPPHVRGTVMEARTLTDGASGAVNFSRVKLNFGPDDKLSFQIGIFAPVVGGPLPTIVHISFFPTPGTPPPPPQPTTRPPTTQSIERRRMFEQMADPQFAAEKYYAPALRRGYAIATFNYQQCGADDREKWKDSGFFAAYPDNDWRDLAAWAWGMSRCVDYMQMQNFVDTSKFIALGHSRLGKATLVAGALDERFALVAPAGSGCAGTGAFR